MKKCPRCGAYCAEGDTYCGNCGVDLSAWKHDGLSGSGDGFAVASMVLGIIGICTFWLGVGVITSVIAVIFGLITLCSNTRRKQGKGMAIAGLATGGFALAITVFFTIFMVGIFHWAATLGLEKMHQSDSDFSRSSWNSASTASIFSAQTTILKSL